MIEADRPERDSGDPAVKVSMYTSVVDNGDGYHLLYNALTGRFLKVASAHVRFLTDRPDRPIPASHLNPLQDLLFEHGFLVPAEADERRRARLQYDSRYWHKRRLELILLPHENCNFRCSYCYETFARNKMEPWVREAIKRFAREKADSFELLEVAWFGGEPTLALDVMDELSAALIGICREKGARYTAQITTNGYLLDEAVARRLVYECKVAQFQITLDGPPGEHNKRRHLAGGGATFDRIYRNLLQMRSIDSPFKVILRLNFDHENAPLMHDFTERLARDFGHDPRFVAHYFPVSKWGGAGDETLPICDAHIGRELKYRLLEAAVERGFSSRIRNEIEPLGTACYAADPNSFIIGADGTIYKCTVAFTDPRNQVGTIRADGSMSIDLDKFCLWVVNDSAADPGCQSCFFNPSCHGMACPLYRMETGQRPCPTVKQSFPEALRILAREMVSGAEPAAGGWTRSGQQLRAAAPAGGGGTGHAR